MIKIYVFAILIGFWTTNIFAADVYKYVDENGNIYYSDKKPSTDIAEEDLSQLTVIKSSNLNPKSTWKRTDHKKQQAASEFENFAIASPSDGSIFRIKNGNMLVMVNLEQELSSKYRIKFYLDSMPRGKVKSSTQLIADVTEGPHNLYAEIVDAKTRKVIKTTPKITFTVKYKE